jgi:hypothetical protein
VKQVMTVRLAPELAAEVRRYADSFTTAVEQALVLWLAREKRKVTTADSRPQRKTVAVTGRKAA